ncbi:hypothetical protein JTB14_036558 [Gonioctena quinquepunctata]|nr:hypothetical protein JTB14_036558 [Gonioctena quinquepunctata]
MYLIKSEQNLSQKISRNILFNEQVEASKEKPALVPVTLEYNEDDVTMRLVPLNRDEEEKSKVVTMTILDDSDTNSNIMNKLLDIQATLSMITLRLNTLESEGKKHEILAGEDLIKDYLPLTDLAQLLEFGDLVNSNGVAFKQLVGTICMIDHYTRRE